MAKKINTEIKLAPQEMVSELGSITSNIDEEIPKQAIASNKDKIPNKFKNILIVLCFVLFIILMIFLVHLFLVSLKFQIIPFFL